MPLEAVRRWISHRAGARDTVREDPDRLVTVLYWLLLDREPDPGSREHYVKALAAGHHAWDSVLRELLTSQEYQDRTDARRGRADVPLGARSAPGQPVGSGPRFEEIARPRPITPARFDAAWERHVAGSGRPLVVGQQEYLEEHRTRFYELVNAMAVLLNAQSAPLVLEVGVSEASALYKAFWPSMRLVTLDRPPLPDTLASRKRSAAAPPDRSATTRLTWSGSPCTPATASRRSVVHEVPLRAVERWLRSPSASPKDAALKTDAAASRMRDHERR